MGTGKGHENASRCRDRHITSEPAIFPRRFTSISTRRPKTHTNMTLRRLYYYVTVLNDTMILLTGFFFSFFFPFCYTKSRMDTQPDAALDSGE